MHHTKKARTEASLFYKLLLKSGYPLPATVEVIHLAGKQVHSVSGGLFFVYLERELPLELIRAMAEKKPERAVGFDEGFAGNREFNSGAKGVSKRGHVSHYRIRHFLADSPETPSREEFRASTTQRSSLIATGRPRCREGDTCGRQCTRGPSQKTTRDRLPAQCGRCE